MATPQRRATVITIAAAAAAIGATASLGARGRMSTEGPGATTRTVGTSPDTTGEALWAYVTAHDFRHWQLWPGKKPFFKGEQPHGALLTVYVDSLAYDALTRRAGRMPPRTIIVKENYGPDRQLKAHTIMYKVPGYSPEHHDWFWGQYAPDGTVLAAGRVGLCYQCHDAAANYDDLWILRDQEYLRSQSR